MSTSKVQELLAGQAAFAEREAKHEPAWLAELRAAGAARFGEAGLPHRGLEEWRYTSLSELERTKLVHAGEAHIEVDRAAVEAHCLPVFACSLFVFVNGRFAPELSVAEGEASGVRVESLAHLRREAPERLTGLLGATADPKAHPFAALADAWLDDGAVVTVQAGVEQDQPVHLVFVSTGEASPVFATPRVLVRAEPGSRAVVLQDHVSLGDGARFTDVVTEVVVERNAALDLALLQRESDDAFHVSNLAARVARDGRLATHTLSLGGALVRNDLEVLLAEENAEAELHGLFLGTGDQLLDNHTGVDHAMPHGRSNELYKGILGGRARGVFRGRVLVRPDAQKTDARQSNPNLLLGDGAEIDTKPQLEIHADDVKCSHGSAIGRLDEDALFYLRSRGIPEPRARDLLTRGFAAEVLDAIGVPALADVIGELILEKLHAAGEGS